MQIEIYQLVGLDHLGTQFNLYVSLGGGGGLKVSNIVAIPAIRE
jgi:hypothetical protein